MTRIPKDDPLLAAVQFIERRLQNRIALRDVAASAGISLYHLHRMFTSRLDDSLKSYIRKRRLTEAARSLRESRDGILDIALISGFESQAAFSRAFKSLFGVAPGGYRRAPGRRYRPGLRAADSATLERRYGSDIGANITELRNPLSLKGLGIGIDFDDEARVVELWRTFVERCADKKHAHVLYGVTMNSHPRVAPQTEQCFVYFAASAQIEAGDSDLIDVEIPTGSYAIFKHHGPLDRIVDTVNAAWGNWLPTSDFRKSSRPDLEILSLEALSTPEPTVEIWLSVERVNGAEINDHGAENQHDGGNTEHDRK